MSFFESFFGQKPDPERKARQQEFKRMGLPKMPSYLEQVHFMSDDKDPHIINVRLIFKPGHNPTLEEKGEIWLNYIAPLGKLHGYDFARYLELEGGIDEKEDKKEDEEGRKLITYTVVSPRERVFGGTKDNPLNITIENNFYPDEDKGKRERF